MGRGLLSDVLPFVFSQGDRAKRYMNGLLADPVGTLQQTAGGIVDAGREQQGLLGRAFADPKQPFQVTDSGALNQAVGNVMAGPMGFAPAGITVYHGSPHVFDKFDSSKIGTGEGAQAYGHGLYLAESPGVAEGYKQRLSTNYVDGAGNQQAYGDVWTRATQAAQGAGAQHPDHARAIASQVQAWIESGKQAKTFLRYNQPPSGMEAPYKAAVDAFSGVKQNPGALYKVDLPDSAVAKMLDYDKPLSQQPQSVQQHFEPLVAPIRKEMAKPADPGWGALAAPTTFDPTGQELLGLLRNRNADMTAQSFLGNGLGPEVSERLRQQDIPGIRYLDGGSRNANQWIAKHPQGGENVFSSQDAANAFIARNPEMTLIPPKQSSNFVVFPGEESLLQILERNGQPLGR